MRSLLGVVLALSVGVGAYLGSAQVADSAKTPPRRVTLQLGDVATAGQVQCRAGSASVRHPAPDYMECSNGPASRAAWRVGVTSVGAGYSKKVGRQVWCGWEAPIPSRHRAIFSTVLSCWGPHVGAYVTVRVLPSGGIAVFKKDKMVYRTGWNG